MAQHTPQEVFRVLVLHNRLLAEEELNFLLTQTPEPEQVIEKMVTAEMIDESVGGKLLNLYRHNLHKLGLDQEQTEDTPVAANISMPQETEHPTPPPRTEAAPRPARENGRERARQVLGTRSEDVRDHRLEEIRDRRREEIRSELRDRRTHSATHIDVTAQDKELVHNLLRAARSFKACDLHIKSGHAPLVRIATLLHELDTGPLPAEVVEKALLSILDERQRRRFLETNDLAFSYDGGQGLGRFRASLLRQIHGVDGVFRLIPDEVPTFDQLKLPAQIQRFTTYRQGIVLITGPMASGKTTTLAALIDLINANRAAHIVTIEDPIEFVHASKKAHINQREVGVHTDSFSSALQAALREAPDVIMVGELRDLETTALAITAAETGHLVFATLPTPDVPRSIARVLDAFPAREQAQMRAMFSESLRGILSQLLIPGADGRSMHLAYEILFNTPSIASLIREHRAFQLKGLMQTHRKQGMVLMDDSLLRLVKEGKITKEEALSRADNLQLLQHDLTH